MTNLDSPPPADVPRIFLQAGQDRRIVAGHPWAFSNEIRMDTATSALRAGVLAELYRVDGKPLGIGTFNPHALIAFRLFDRNPHASIDRPWFAERLKRALRLRQSLYGEPFYRLVHAEADGLPGLVADRFGEVLVLQLNTAGIEVLSQPLLAAIDDVIAPAAIVLRNDSRARALEGLEMAVAVIKGEIGEAIAVREAGLVFYADLLAGQKTGWFYDQRENRRMIEPLVQGGGMLDVYCHSGGFAVAAARGGAKRVVAVDSSDPALALARRAAAANDAADICDFRRADAFDEMQRLGDSGQRFRLVVADPPAFVRSRKELGSGLKGYRKLARLAAPLVEPGGFLFVASCSHPVESPAFLAEIRRGVVAAGRNGRILYQGGAGFDHPVHLHLPETAYLKSLLLHLD